MKQTSFIILIPFLLIKTFVFSHAGEAPSPKLDDIFRKANSVRYLSYQTKVTSPANTVRTFRIWIHDDNTYVSKLLGGIKKIGEKSYIYQNDKWIESPGLTVNSVIRFLKEAEAAEDTRIIGQESIDGKETTVIKYTQPRPKWGSEIIIKLWISNETYIPLRVRADNITQKKVQTEEITDISFKENEYLAFFRDIEERKERRRRAKEKPKPWHPEKEEQYSKLIRMEGQKALTPAQKIVGWESFLKSIQEKDPSTRRDDQMRFKARTRIYYWKYMSRFEFSDSGVIKDTKTGLEWLVGPDSDTDWEAARSWVAGLTVDAGGWRLPTIDELKNVHGKSVYGRFHPPFYQKTKRRLIWSGEWIGTIGSWYFNYTMGRKYSNNISVSKNMRAVAVRAQ